MKNPAHNSVEINTKDGFVHAAVGLLDGHKGAP
jgi:hypothetical protein